MNNFIKKYTKELTAGALSLLAYFPTLIWMWDRWFARDSYYSHGILIPFVTGFLIWQLRGQLKTIKPSESVWGMRLIILGILLHVVSAALRVYFSSGFSMLIVLVGLILYFWGTEFLKRIAFPIFFLMFMIPVPLVVIANVSFQMKMFAAQMATVLINNMGIPALREGSIIKMPHAYVIVDDVCSGLRSLISLTALGSIFAYWMKAPAVKRLILFLSTVPIAVLTNVFRVLFLSFVAEIWGLEYTSGIIHDVSGFLVFALAFVMLLAVKKLLE